MLESRSTLRDRLFPPMEAPSSLLISVSRSCVHASLPLIREDIEVSFECPGASVRSATHGRRGAQRPDGGARLDGRGTVGERANRIAPLVVAPLLMAVPTWDPPEPGALGAELGVNGLHRLRLRPLILTFRGPTPDGPHGRPRSRIPDD